LTTAQMCSKLGSMGKKRRIYDFIKSEITAKGLPPTIREIGEHFNISSTNGVRYFLDRLEGDGLIKRKKWTARGIRLLEGEAQVSGVAIPILGRVPAGRPSFSEEYVEDTILVDDRYAGNDVVFAVRVHGDSMIGAGINDGDIAVVKQDPRPQNGEIVVALIEDEVTLKRFMMKGGKLILKAENDQYPDINLSDLGHDRIRIIGSVISIIRRFY
jgi:repressor LexA